LGPKRKGAGGETEKAVVAEVGVICREVTAVESCEDS
jgi:hypothetical protein